MLMPGRVKFRKQQRGINKGIAVRGSTISFGDFAMKAQEVAWITSAQIESARRTITHNLKKGGRVWIRIFPDKPVSKKPLETRMGKGKGGPEFWVAVIKPGRVLFEVSGVSRELAHEALATCSYKLPIKCKVVARPDYE